MMFTARVILPSIALLSGPVAACLAMWQGLGGGEWLSQANVATAVRAGLLEGAVLALVLVALLSPGEDRFRRVAAWMITGVQTAFGLAFMTWIAAGAGV